MTTTTTWQRQQYNRNRTRRAAAGRSGITGIGILVTLLGAAIAVLGAPYPGAIVAALGGLVVAAAFI